MKKKKGKRKLKPHEYPNPIATSFVIGPREINSLCEIFNVHEPVIKNITRDIITVNSLTMEDFENIL